MEKSPDAFRTISEVAEWLDTPAHVLRFWESKFAQVKPIKRAGGRRYYRPADMALLGGLKKLLHEDGLSIKGAQTLLREQGVRHVAAMSPPIDTADMPDEVEVEVEDAIETSEVHARETGSETEDREDFEADAPPTAPSAGLPPLVLGAAEIAGIEDDVGTGAEVPDAVYQDDQDQGDQDQPELPFLHRSYPERLPHARPDRQPLLRSGAAALDARTPPSTPETVDLPAPEPLKVPQLEKLRAALNADPPSPGVRARIKVRLIALARSMAEDRTG